MSSISGLVRVAGGLLLAGGLITSAPVGAAMADKRSSEVAQACWMELDTGLSLCTQHEEDLGTAVLRSYGLVIVTSDTQVAGVDATLATTTAIGAIYDNTNYGAPSYLVTVSGSSGCAGGSSYGYTDLSTIGWNNRISSFRSYAGCKTAIFDGTNYGGSSYGYVTNAPSVGSMDNRASSIRWSS